VLDEGSLIALAAGPEGRRYAAVDYGLLRSQDYGASWEPVFEAADVPATAVIVALDGAVFVAVPGGIGRLSGNDLRFVRLPDPPPTVVSFAVGMDGTVFAGTMSDGMLLSADGGETWQSSNAGLFDHDVRGVATLEEGVILSATSTGLFRSGNGGRRWSPFGDLPDLAPVNALASVEIGVLFAAVESMGLWHSRDGGARWTRIAPDQVPAEIDLIAVSPVDRLVGITGATGAFRSADNGKIWSPSANLIAALAPS
jgi:photosystem II stability/assembly factor-like uncharacterized protein